MARALNLTSIDTQYILDRTAALESMFADRNRRMNQYERMYRLDIWPESRKVDEVRVTLPLAYDAVEKMRALLITRPPAVSVPYTTNNPEDQERGQKLERYLYGAMSRLSFVKQFSDAEWFAMCLGRGWLKLAYDKEAAEYDEDFPLVLTAPDPRTIYYQLSPRKDRCVELVQKWERSRRDIEDEFNYEFPRPSDKAGDLAMIAAWLDEKVWYIEYWKETTAWVQDDSPEEKKLELVTDLVSKALLGNVTGQDQNYQIDDAGAKAEPEEDKPKRVKVRRVVHAIAVDDPAPDSFRGTLIKKAVVMPGYKHIPFYGWAGTSTPMAGANSDLSILFPLSNGDGGDKAMGVLGALSMLATVDLQTAFDSPGAPIISDDPDATIDMSRNAINYVKPGTNVTRLAPDGTNPAVGRTSELLNQQVSRVTVPQVMSGDYMNLSGQAVSGLSSAYQMMLGFRQQERETQVQYMLSAILCLTEYYGDEMEGWTAWGNNSIGRYVEQAVKPADIGGNHRTVVKLSASMPKDTMGMVSAISMLQSKKQISLETMLDMIQKLPDFGLAAETPTDEIERILRDAILMEGKVAESVAGALASEYIDLIMGRSGATPEQIMQVRSLMYPQPPQQQGPPQGQPQLPPGQQGMPMPPNGGPPMPPQMPGGGAPPPPAGPPGIPGMGDMPPEVAAMLQGGQQ